MKTKHQRTLARIFENPIRSDIEWSDIERLMISLGGTLFEGRGSRIRIELNGVDATFHRPHPQKETKRGAIKQVRSLLIKAGIPPC